MKIVIQCRSMAEMIIEKCTEIPCGGHTLKAITQSSNKAPFIFQSVSRKLLVETNDEILNIKTFPN